MARLTLKWAWRGEATTEDEVAVVVDILRASTTITTCIHHGAAWLMPTVEVDDARRLAREHDALLMGERDSVRVEGFDLGNSPCAITREAVRGRRIVFSSTSFPRAAAGARRSPAALLGCMLNVSAVAAEAARLAAEAGRDICFMLAGAPDNPAGEDLAFAGLAASLMPEAEPDARVARAMDFVAERGVEDCVRESFHGRRLARLGFGADVEFACRRDVFSGVPVLSGGRIAGQ